MTIPAYFPLWSVAVDKEIVANHDDFWNPHVVQLIGLLFADACERSERLAPLEETAP
jgi:hypothetical protein